MRGITGRLPARIWSALFAVLLLAALLPAARAGSLYAQDNATIPPAPIVNDEGGPVAVTGDVTYTNAFFTLGVASPMVILEDQAGFVDRNRGFLMPVESQTLGQITSDFFTSPFSYSIALPIEPRATLRDVDNDGEEDAGVMVYAVAYWNNIFGDPFLEKRDLQGGGWSTAYASTNVSDAAANKYEIVGGKLLIYAPDGEQGFPSGFGADGMLFTDDDPIVSVPQGYTVVNLDTDPFTFDRSRRAKIDLIEPEGVALADYSRLGYAEAFDALVEKLSNEYAFTEYKGIDWEALHAKYRPRLEQAEADRDSLEYRRALRDFSFEIPDGHVSGPNVVEDFQQAISGGLGFAMRDVDDGRTIVNFLTPGGPAESAGIELGAEIVALDGTPVDEYVDNTIAYSAPFSTEHFARLQKLRYATRAPLGSEVEVTYRNPDAEAETTAVLETSGESESFSFSSFNTGLTGFELPVEYSLMEEEGIGYVKINSFSDNSLLTVQLWERMIRTLNASGAQGLIIDMRQNAGGSGFLADQMAAYFFDEELELGNTGYYDKTVNDFTFDERTVDRFYPPSEDLRYHGPIAVIIGPNCNSACEFFTYDMILQDRADVVGQYPTAGLGGSVDAVLMPDNQFFQFTIGRAVDMNGEIHIEGKGVAPTVRVPVTEETLLGGGDPLLDAAVETLIAQQLAFQERGALTPGTPVTAELAPRTMDIYALTVDAGDLVSLSLAAQDDLFDPLLQVYDLGFNLLFENDDSAPGVRSAALEGVEVSENMTLLVIVLGAQTEEGGAYTLAATVSQPGATIPPASPAAAASAPTPISVAILVADTPLYAEPRAGAQEIGRLPAGSEYELLDVSADGEWLLIAAPELGEGEAGWTRSDATDYMPGEQIAP